MTRFRHDHVAKQFLSDLLEPLGTVEPNRKITDETRKIDLYFIPDPNRDSQSLGLLGRIVSQRCLLEPFRNAVKDSEIRSALIKQSVVDAELRRQAQRDQTKAPRIPFLWILTPTASAEILSGYRAELDLNQWPEGIYVLPPRFETALVVIYSLPGGPETLWLRLLGRGSVQQQAIQELLALPEDDPMRENALRGLSNCRILVDVKQEALDEAERELIMNLSPVFLEWEEKTRIEGKREAALSMAQRLLKRRFGILSPDLQHQIEHLSIESLEDLGEALLDITTLDDLKIWLGTFRIAEYQVMMNKELDREAATTIGGTFKLFELFID